MTRIRERRSLCCASAAFELDSTEARERAQAIFLTFDDGPNPFSTPDLLDVLAEHEVTATFCVIGAYAAEYPDLIRRIVAQGHGLVNHTMTHPDFSECTPDEIDRQIGGANEVIASICPQASLHYVRAPYGIWTAQARAASARLGLEPLTWTIDPCDWSCPGVDAIEQAVLDAACPGAVILLHDGCPPDELPPDGHRGLRDQTIMAVRRLIPALHDRGFVFAPLPCRCATSPRNTHIDMP
ncbi:chitooligosaccharide deacetylase NodB [Paraburkholderia sp. 22099]|jgi:chitooligosaccharide deacetylase|uniref:chitooligosaccharide deacetylase NodB n=1 Tax=Paraburkholderia TaxID=1822464 RepID=UPI002855A37F|nr:chitooligosaccharide deacetylase NodB [Paraburkholderia terricola]MDR6450315.1 chitooligosaccharide deacetylase [Paraburkholderia terricola]